MEVFIDIPQVCDNPSQTSKTAQTWGTFEAVVVSLCIDKESETVDLAACRSSIHQEELLWLAALLSRQGGIRSDVVMCCVMCDVTCCVMYVISKPNINQKGLLEKEQDSSISKDESFLDSIYIHPRPNCVYVALTWEV